MTATDEAAAGPATPSTSPLRAALAIAPGCMLAGVAGGMAFPILPVVGERAGLPLAFIGLILAANRATRVIANPLVGMLVDRIGGRRTLLLGLALQVVVMILYVLGVRTGRPGLFFLAGRVLHGPGSSCVFVAGQALALHAGGATHGGRVGGLVRAAMALGVPVGLVLGGVLAAYWGDAAAFETAIVALALAGVGAYALVPDLRVHAGARGGLLDALRGMRDARLAAIGGLNFASAFAGSGMVLTTTVLLVQARHIAPYALPERAAAGLFMGWLVVVEALSMPVLGRIGDAREAHARIGAFGVAAMVPALVVIALAHGSWSLALGLGLLGLGTGALGPSVLALIGQLVAAERRGIAVGVMSVCGDIGGAAGPLVGTALFANDVATPYFVSAGVVALFVPSALWLARVARRATPQGG